jgi:hypothetical protein
MRKKLMIFLVYQLKYTTLGYLLFTPNEFTFVQGYMGTSMLRHLVTRYNVHRCQSKAQKMIAWVFAHVPMLYDVFGVRGSMFDEG